MTPSELMAPRISCSVAVLAVEIAVFSLSAVALWTAIGPVFALGFGAVVAINLVLMVAWAQR